MKFNTIFGLLVFYVLSATAQEGTPIPLDQKFKDSIDSKDNTAPKFEDLLATAHTDSLWLASIAEMIPLGKIASE